MLTTPKRGEELRQELGTRADELATKARDEWVPLFQGADATNGHPDGPVATVADTTASIEEAAADAGTSGVEATEQAAADTAEAINDVYDSVDRESDLSAPSRNEKPAPIGAGFVVQDSARRPRLASGAEPAPDALWLSLTVWLSKPR